MIFDRYCGSLPHGALRWWQPEYFHAPTPAAVDAWFPPRDQAVRATCIAAFCAGRREQLAPLNREMRDAPVRLFALGQRIILVSTYDGTWRSADGANRGADLIELGAWRWACRYGQAAHRIARLCGLRGVPTVAP